IVRIELDCGSQGLFSILIILQFEQCPSQSGMPFSGLRIEPRYLSVCIECFLDPSKFCPGMGERCMIAALFLQVRLHAKGSIQLVNTLLISPHLYKDAPELSTRVGRIG